MASKWIDRTLTIVVTATLTSAVWIVGGGTLMEMADSDGQRDTTRPADAAPSPSAAIQQASPGTDGGQTFSAPPLDRGGASQPEPEQSKELIIPVLNIRPDDLTDTFADARGGATRLHEAIDIMAPVGTTVVAASPGTIEKLFTSKAGGKTIYIRSNDRLTLYYYAHLLEYAEGLREGQRVRRGQRIGAVGISGNASDDAPHLHFSIMRTTADAEWWEPANAVNPFPLLAGKPAGK